MKPIPRKRCTKLRPRFQRELVRWLQENHHRFSTPLRLATRTDKVMEFTFPELTSYLSVRFYTNEIRVSVTKRNDEFDAILDLDIYLEHCPLGYFCGFQYPEQRQYFATRDAIWKSELFEPFLDWVNQELAPARWLRFFRTTGGSAASLIYSQDDIQRPDPAMRLLASLKSLDDEQPIYDPGKDDVQVWVVSIRREEGEEYFHGKINLE